MNLYSLTIRTSVTHKQNDLYGWHVDCQWDIVLTFFFFFVYYTIKYMISVFHVINKTHYLPGERCSFFSCDQESSPWRETKSLTSLALFGRFSRNCCKHRKKSCTNSWFIKSTTLGNYIFSVLLSACVCLCAARSHLPSDGSVWACIVYDNTYSCLFLALISGFTLGCFRLGSSQFLSWLLAPDWRIFPCLRASSKPATFRCTLATRP